MKIVACNSNQPLAEGISAYLNQPLTKAIVRRFSDMEVFVDLRGLIDVEAEKARLEKDSDKLTKLIAGKEKKLSNANFVERAPAEVVEKERAALTDLQHQLAKTQSALDSLPNDSQ